MGDKSPIEARLIQAGFSPGEVHTYRKWWVTGEGYDTHRELINSIEQYRTLEGF